MAEVAAGPVPALIEPAWVVAHLPARPRRAHKGSFGRLLVVAGSLEYAGAALLTGLGAARAGVGLVTIATAESVALRLMGQVPELTMMPLAEEAPGLIAPAGWRRLPGEAAAYQAAVVGPGLGRHPATLRRVRGLVGDLRVPTVVDADGLNALAQSDRWWRDVGGPLVLTPHPGEFARLVGGAGGDAFADDDAVRAEAAREAADRWRLVVVLKGANTVIAAPDGELLVSGVATPALATAGSGDVLAGAIGALLAAGLAPFEAAACGVAIHGAAGVLAEERIGSAGVLARDVADLLPIAAERLRRGARA
jgi:NAD(P)H-hydrate epimerase